MASSLARFAHMWREEDQKRGRQVAREAWQATGLILINPEWLGWVERQQAVTLAEKLHGKRKGS